MATTVRATLPAVTKPEPESTQIGAVPALGIWTAAWVLGLLVISPIVLVALGAKLGDDLTVPQLAAATAGTWVVFVVALRLASSKFGRNDMVIDYGVQFRPIDLVGVPIGIAMQLAVIPLVYRPLRWMWPSTFSADEVERRATELVDSAGDRWLWLLVLIVVVGAPIIEELVYRGLLQRAAVVAVGRPAAWLLASLWFAIIHFSPVEYPGLFLAGLAFGVGVLLTGRIGMGIVTHMAFNAAGMAVVLWW